MMNRIPGKHFWQPATGNRPLLFKTLAIVLVCIMALPQLIDARVQPTHGFDLFSPQEEVQAGQQASADANKQLPILSDSDPITKYIQRLGATLASHAPGEKWPYNFHVVNQKEINAFAMPGGPVYINLGTIQAADNEAEVAAVMSHEISHVVQRHSTRAATRQMEAQLPLSLLGGFLGKGIGSQIAQLGIQFGVGSYFLKNSRQNEQEADLLGTDIMYDTGYNPRWMAEFFRKLQQQGGSSTAQFFSDHPIPANRYQYVSKEVATLPAKQYLPDSTPEFAQIKQRAMGMKPLTQQQIQQQQKSSGNKLTGTALEGVGPSSTFRDFQHDAYTISYPDNWQVYGRSSGAVTIAPQSGVTQDQVAYGAIVSGFQPEDSNSLDLATHELITRLRQGNPQLKQIGHDEDIRINGMAAKSADMVGVSPVKDQSGNPLRERDWLVTLPLSNSQQVLYLVFITPEPDYSQMHPVFEAMLRSLRLR